MQTTETRRIQGLSLPMGLGIWRFDLAGEPSWGHGGLLIPFLSRTIYLDDSGISMAYSFISTRRDSQGLPGLYLAHTLKEYDLSNSSGCPLADE